jgi:hypothetical protein
MRADRSMCSAGWPNPRSVANESATSSSVSRTPKSDMRGPYCRLTALGWGANAS